MSNCRGEPDDRFKTEAFFHVHEGRERLIYNHDSQSVFKRWISHWADLFILPQIRANWHRQLGPTIDVSQRGGQNIKVVLMMGGGRIP